jgi:hypothetical protein
MFYCKRSKLVGLCNGIAVSAVAIFPVRSASYSVVGSETLVVLHYQTTNYFTLFHAALLKIILCQRVLAPLNHFPRDLLTQLNRVERFMLCQPA